MQEEDVMAGESTKDVKETHQRFAIETNNATWDLIEKADRTHAEEIEMVHQAHASAWHWSKVGEPVNLVRAHYLVAKVYFAVHQAKSGSFWANHVWKSTTDLGLTSWDYAFACEIMARARALECDKPGFEDYHAKAVRTIENLDADDAALCQGELDRGPWFEMK